MGFVSKIFRPSVPKQETPAQPAADVSAPTSTQESAVDSTGDSLKRKAKGKKGLMITSTASNSTGGGTSGGTGLNI